MSSQIWTPRIAPCQFNEELDVQIDKIFELIQFQNFRPAMQEN